MRGQLLESWLMLTICLDQYRNLSTFLYLRWLAATTLRETLARI